jgi:pimeloyl-ACP methyl ester carboxylesterase/DNA-binding CsgD family transcriptional regulator
MTDWRTGELSVERWTDDLEAVVAAARPKEPFALLGISQGAAACVAYAVAHPERVSHLLLYGGYARGWSRRGTPVGEREYNAVVEAARVGWGKDLPAFRQLFTSRFIPGATSEQTEWFNELCRKSTTAEIAGDLLRARATLDVVELLDRVRTPTLVLHARDDVVVPVAEGRLLASRIPGAEFVELESRNHVLLEGEPAWPRFCAEVLEFTGLGGASAGEDRAFAELTLRERGILSLLTEGLSNAEIAERLDLSDKTVRNHISNVFDKLGVWTRAQAIVFARDRGFRG